MSESKKPSNLGTALVLVSVAVVFFVGVIIKRIYLP
jgi:hypothetical protein